MQTQQHYRLPVMNFPRAASGVLGLAIALLLGVQAQAAVTGVGDVLPQQIFTDVPFGFGDDEQLVTLTSPNLPFYGGRMELVEDDGMGGETTTPLDLIVGGTGVFSGTILEDGTEIGTNIGAVTINSPTNTLPLITENVVIGMESDGVGRITITDFNATLIAEEEMIVGDEGVGELRLLNGAVVGVGEYDSGSSPPKYDDGILTLGMNREVDFLSEGTVIMDGFGTKLQTDDLIVGGAGKGTMELSNNALLSTIDTSIGEFAGGTGKVTLTGLNTRWNNTGNLAVGLAGNGLVEINEFAVLQSNNMDINVTSFVDLAGGSLFVNTAIDNDGVLRGWGRIESDINISGVGELRNYGDVGVYYPAGESLVVTGAVVNDGTIEALGGEMEFQDLVTNNFELIARDSVLHFRGGLSSTGTIVVGGDTQIHGDVGVGSGGFLVLGDSSPLLTGDLAFTAAAVLGLTVGDDTGTLDVTGSADLSSAIVALEYSAGIASQVGDSYSIFEAAGGISGWSDTTAVADGRIWSITNVGNELIATATGAGPLSSGPDFDGSGIVDAADLAIWEMYFGASGPAGSLGMFGDADGDGDVDGSDYFEILRFFGSPPPLAAVVANVPEPSTFGLSLLALAGCSLRRVRR